jgi:hypothetical protein
MSNQMYEKQKLYHPNRTIRSVYHPQSTKQMIITLQFMNHKIIYESLINELQSQ